MTTLTSATIAAMNPVLLPSVQAFDGRPRLAVAASLSVNLHSYGWSLSGNLLDAMAALPFGDLADLFPEVLETVRSQLGGTWLCPS